MSDFTPAVQRAEEALDALLEYGIKPAAIRDALAAALDVGETAQILREADDTYSRDDGTKTGHDYARHLAVELRTAILGADQ